VIAALALLAAAAAAGQTVADAERAFAEQARTGGQWNAFRAFAAPDAVLYSPTATPARTVLSRAIEPTTPLLWRPAHTLTSCDGTLAYSTGPWTKDGKSGSFGTLWRHDTAGWKWIYDGGHDGGVLASAPIGAVAEDHAACPGPIGSVGEQTEVLPDVAVPVATLRGGALASLIMASDGPMPASLHLGHATEEGASVDRTLRWRINPVRDAATGAHLLRIWSWDGRRYRLAVFDVTGTRS
jgi:hypothetical protein